MLRRIKEKTPGGGRSFQLIEDRPPLGVVSAGCHGGMLRKDAPTEATAHSILFVTPSCIYMPIKSH